MRTDELALDYISRAERTMEEAKNAIKNAVYGDERAFTPASQLFTKEEGFRALRDAEEVFEICKRLIKQ